MTDRKMDLYKKLTKSFTDVDQHIWLCEILTCEQQFTEMETRTKIEAMTLRK